MTTEVSKYPPGFRPFTRLVVCSNSLENVNAIIEVNNTPFLLVGSGNQPEVWLSMPEYLVGSTSSLVWVYAINRNRTKQKQFEIKEEAGSTTVSFDGNVILEAHKTSSDEGEITQLDLRPVGLEIHGDTSGLNLGSNVLKNNSFARLNSMIAMAGKVVIGYNIYTSTDPDIPLEKWTRVNDRPVPTTNYKSKGLAPGTTYYYYVTSVNALRGESAPSNITSATTMREDPKSEKQP